MNAYAGSSGIVDLKKDSALDGSFYVETDLTYHPSKSSKNPNAPGTVKMMISIPNQDSVVSSMCLNFTNYDCSKYNCSQYGDTRLIEYPYFSTKAQRGRADLYLDYNHWSLEKSAADLFFARECQSKKNNLGSGRYGVIGLGISEFSQENFKSSKAFSFQIDSDLSKGKILFKNDPSTYANSSSPVLVVSANSTWQKEIEQGTLEVDIYLIVFKGNLAFDINSDAIAVPDLKYRDLLFYLNNFFEIECGSEPYRPICNSKEKIHDLPNITLNINQNKIHIPPKVYATAINETAFYLNFRGTSPDLTGKSYVTPSFKDSIILDARFMSYYYTVFDFSTGKNDIYLYKAKEVGPQPQSDPDSSYTFWIALVIVLVVTFAGIWWYYGSKKKPIVANAPQEIPFVPIPPAPAENDVIDNQALLRNYE